MGGAFFYERDTPVLLSVAEVPFCSEASQSRRVSRWVRVVHLGRSTCHAISGRGDQSTRIPDVGPEARLVAAVLASSSSSLLSLQVLDGP